MRWNRPCSKSPLRSGSTTPASARCSPSRRGFNRGWTWRPRSRGPRPSSGIIPEAAAREIVRKAHLSFLDLAAVREGLARTGHPLVPLVWELDRACEGDAGGYVHWGATTQNVTQTGQLLQVRRAHEIFLRQLAAILTTLADLAERTKDVLLPGPHPWPARGAGHLRLQGRGVDRRARPPRRAPAGLRGPRVRGHAGRRRGHARLAGRARPGHPGADGRVPRHAADALARAHHRRPPGRVRAAAGHARGHLAARSGARSTR